jgi:heat shock protein HslJ
LINIYILPKKDMSKFILSVGILAFVTFSCETPKQVSLETPKVNTPVADDAIVEKYWKLVELNGKQVTVGANGKEPHMILKKENNRVNGNGGCNSFMGGYELKGNGSIKFTQMAGTLMACMNDDGTESAFLKVLGNVDSYYVKGDTLQLNRARMAPLAKFQAVYLK